MSISGKIILLLFIFLLLNFISIFTFNYDEYFKDKSGSNINFENKSSFNLFNKTEYKPSDFTITKIDNSIELSGTFENQKVAQDVIQALGINKEGTLTYQNNFVVDKGVLETIFLLIVPFKDFFTDNSKISVINNEILLSGELKNKMYKNLIDTIILQKSKNIILKTEISIPEDNPINNQQNENSNEEVIKNETLKLPEIQLLINNILKDKKISFERKSSILTEQSQNTIKEIAKILNENPNFKVEVAGHTDSRGEAALNKQISQDRANSVKNILVNSGVNETRIKAIGYGEEFPIAKDDENGLSEINRRVEFIIGE
ncbi:OmpA family protein [Aliarcobacter butzleri]|uniref:OmpA family protein n=1 Tax=Aliarcobacter butzleri TaxID=28197 RepID=UPI001EDA127C|nr:OmpA family protein [Aliarcobacter butzleri]MCG3651530.1 OmpA family protein [Aliarcobacter butzleri]MCG3672219.1 OmpA family protein [Aliarcobacter butzleri]MCG3689940.1 OmpA family protein [Aliarcobacter butzleri]